MVDVTHCPTINKTKDRSKVNKRRKRPPNPLGKLSGWSCSICPQQLSCKVLCPPMEWIVKQVEVDPGREWIPENPEFEPETGQWPEDLSTSEIIFSLYFFDQKTPQQISIQLSISTSYIYRAINQSKQILMKNLRKKVESGS